MKYLRPILFILLIGLVTGQTLMYKRAGRWKLGPPPPPPRSSTFRGVTFSYADSASSTPIPGTISPHDSANMKAGDLCVLFGVSRTANLDLILSATGGQTWDTTSHKPLRAALVSGELYFCEFNGTWTGRPSMTVASGTNPFTVGMAVFRPADSSAHVWSVHVAMDTARVSGTVLYTTSNPSSTVDSTIGFALFASQDDNAWRFTGGNWTDGTSSLGWKTYAGSDQSVDFRYLLKAGAGAFTAAADSQVARGDDAGAWGIIVFR